MGSVLISRRTSILRASSPSTPHTTVGIFSKPRLLIQTRNLILQFTFRIKILVTSLPYGVHDTPSWSCLLLASAMVQHAEYSKEQKDMIRQWHAQRMSWADIHRQFNIVHNDSQSLNRIRKAAKSRSTRQADTHYQGCFTLHHPPEQATKRRKIWLARWKQRFDSF